jgi:hypothetical protein
MGHLDVAQCGNPCLFVRASAPLRLTFLKNILVACGSKDTPSGMLQIRNNPCSITQPSLTKEKLRLGATSGRPKEGWRLQACTAIPSKKKNTAGTKVGRNPSDGPNVQSILDAIKN